MVKILIIDDSAFQRKILSGTLTGLGYEVITADNGHQGVETAIAEKPDVVITDLLMPEYDGFWVLEQYKAGKIRTPVIILTSDIQLTTMEKCRLMGAVAFLNKPVKKEEIRAAVENALAGGKP
jgi:CheY-like chemotaxis protein